jgi:nucleoid DNA-binding protein
VVELIQVVARRAGITSAQSVLAVEAMLAYLTARLPSPMVGRIREQLGEDQRPRQSVIGEKGDM